jgi:hypothetical protein
MCEREVNRGRERERDKGAERKIKRAPLPKFIV